MGKDLALYRNIDGIKIIEERDYEADAKSGYECWAYLFGKSNARKIGIYDIERLKEEVLRRPNVEPRKNAIAAYMDDYFALWAGRYWRLPMHIGRVVKASKKNIIVRSKFGVGDVFEHPISLVPTIYGKYVKFVYIDKMFDGF